MTFDRERQALVIHIRLHRRSHLFDQCLASSVIDSSNVTGQRRTCHLVLHKCLGRGKADHPHVCADTNRPEASLKDQTTKLLCGITEAKGRAHDGSSGWAYVAVQGGRESGEAWTVSKRSPDERDEASSRLEHSTHFSRRLRTVWKVLKPELTEHCVKGAHVKRERSGIAFFPLY